VSLGAVRLKIIDLEHGDQPMISDDGDTVLVSTAKFTTTSN
jgi:asparagine synthetase B (glutamine-hydrolysing)